MARELSSCGTRAQLLRGMWDLPGPGIESVSPALAGGFLTTVPPGKSTNEILIIHDSRLLCEGIFISLTLFFPYLNGIFLRNLFSLYL